MFLHTLKSTQHVSRDSWYCCGCVLCTDTDWSHYTDYSHSHLCLLKKIKDILFLVSITATVDVDIWNMLTSTAVDVDIVTFTLFCISFNTFLWLLNTEYETIVHKWGPAETWNQRRITLQTE